MIRGNFSEATVAQVVRDQDDLLEGSAIQLSEAEQEVLVDVERQQKLGERLSAEDLVRKFEARPYGWSNWATLTFIARLYRLGKLELREKELLSSVEVIEALTNIRRLGGVSVRKQEQFDTSTVNALKRFHQELFNVQSLGTDARSTCEAFRMAMAEEAPGPAGDRSPGRQLPLPGRREALGRAGRGDGQEGRRLPAQPAGHLQRQLAGCRGRPAHPLKQFLNGNQKSVYDQVKAFEARYGDELADLPADLVAPMRTLLTSDRPYAGGLIPQATNAHGGTAEAAGAEAAAGPGQGPARDQRTGGKAQG